MLYKNRVEKFFGTAVRGFNPFLNFIFKLTLKLTLNLILFFTLSSCVTEQAKENAEIERYIGSVNDYSSNGCKAMLDNYCEELYSPKALGNILLNRKKPIVVLQGETHNQLSQVFLKYSMAKIRNQKRFPADFLETLNKYSYFQKLEDFIHRTPINRMTLDERLSNENLSYELSFIWQSSVEQTILNRLSSKYKGFHQMPDKLMPIEYDVEQKRARRKLISEISKAVWRDDANWKKVIEGFKELKSSYISLFNKLDLPASVLNDWQDKIQDLELVLPGSLPEISDEECSTTQINAFYYNHLNIITVCAGDFNSEDILLTLAHEMGHALDISRDLYKKLRASNLGSQLSNLREMSCSKPEEFSCTKWDDFKKTVSSKLTEIRSYKPQLYEFQKCLKKSTNSKKIESSDYERIASKISNSRIAYLASQNLFLRLIKQKLPLRNGQLQKNPNYMNPCGYYLWSKNEEPIDDEIYTLIFFMSEFKCGSGSEIEKLNKSIAVAKFLTSQIEEAAIQAEGEFSDRVEMTSEGLSSPPFERFADVLGSYAVSEYLSHNTSVWDQRTKFLASSSWICSEPSLESKYPEESKVERLYTIESHTQGEERKMELLSHPIRKVLGCEKDFEFHECTLPFKK
ncbi:MAG: hypothetical protein ACXVCY_03800 [Pseudobdellovibrionaceae bacterium]